MKRLFFIELKFKSWSSVLVLVSIVFIIIGNFDFLPIQYKEFTKHFSKIGFFMQALYFSKVLWYKNYAEWNKKGMNLKLNEFWGKQIVFDFVSRVDFDNETQILKIIDNRGFEKIFNATDIQKQDIDKLLAILYENVGLKVV